MGCGAASRYRANEERYSVSNPNAPAKLPEELSKPLIDSIREGAIDSIEVNPGSASIEDDSSDSEAFGRTYSTASNEQYNKEWARENAPMELPKWLERRLSRSSKRSASDDSSGFSDVSALSSKGEAAVSSPKTISKKEPKIKKSPSGLSDESPVSSGAGTPKRKVSGEVKPPDGSPPLTVVTKEERRPSQESLGTPKLVSKKAKGNIYDLANDGPSPKTPSTVDGTGETSKSRKLTGELKILSIALEPYSEPIDCSNS